jgi:hypothetical protein
MKTSIKEKENKFEYPFLGISSKFEVNRDIIMLFFAPGKGVVLKQGSNNNSWDIGVYRQDVVTNYFTKFDKKITLRND